jgi:zinc protease
VLELLTEILREPTFPDEEFNVLKREVRAGLEKSKTNPQSLAIRAMRRKLSSYPKDDVRYAPTVEESLERLDAVTLDEVRKLYAEQLGGQNGELIVIGDFDPAVVLKQMESALKDWKARVAYKRIERPMRGEVVPVRVRIDTPDKESAIYLAATGMALTDTHPDNAALVLADFVFGGGALSSRLMNRIRQSEGLSYGGMSHYNANAQDKSATFFMAASCNPKNIDKLDNAMLDELSKMDKDGITVKELAEAKKAYLASLKQQRASDSKLAMLLQSEVQVGRSIAYYGELEKKIADLTVEEVNSAFRTHIDPKKLVIIRAGDFKK